MQERCFACVIEPEEEQFGVLVGQTEVGEDFPDCAVLVGWVGVWVLKA